MHAIDGGDVELAEPVPALHAGAERDVRVFSDKTHADTGTKAQMAIVRAQQHFGASAMVDGLPQHWISAGKQPAAIGGEQ